MPAATMAHMTTEKRHERPDIPAGYKRGRAMRRSILMTLLESTKPIGVERLGAMLGCSHMTARSHCKRLLHARLVEHSERGYTLTVSGQEAAYLISDLV